MPRTVPVSATQVPGNFVTSALWNAGPAACNTFLTTVPLCQATQNTAQNISGAGVFTAITLDATALDTDGMHSNVTNNSRATCQVAGWYLVIGTIAFSANASNARVTQVYKNGTPLTYAQSAAQAVNAGGPWTVTQIANLVQLAVSDYVEIYGYQNSGSTLATQPTATSMQCIWLHV
jgi:hypothetical protein